MYLLLLEDELPFTGAYSEEDVFVLYGSRYKHLVVYRGSERVPNMSPTPAVNFRVLQRDMDRLSVPDGSRVLGVAHRHPPGYELPSVKDIQGLPRNYLGIVWCEGVISLYDRKGVHPVKLAKGSKKVVLADLTDWAF